MTKERRFAMRTPTPVLRRIFASLLILGLTVAVANCGNNKTEDTSSTDAPTLPPDSTFSMTMGLSEFPAAALALSGASIAAAPAGTNYTFAAVNVGVWNLIITVGLAVPVLTFAESFNHTPVLQPDGSWLWSYSKTIVDTYSAKLNGKVSGGQVIWNMYISKTTGADQFTDFNWFTGTADLAATAGNWTMRKSPTEPVDLLSIDWHRNAAAGTGDIKFTNVEANAAEEGGYISFRRTSDTPYDSFYDIYAKSADNLINIEWNSVTKEGGVMNQQHFGDALWHYWDSALQNI
jgi:hypothetical protein